MKRQFKKTPRKGRSQVDLYRALKAAERKAVEAVVEPKPKG